MENIRKDIREIEKHLASMAADKDAQIAYLSKAQNMVLAQSCYTTLRQDEYHFAVLTVAKNRIIHSM